MSIGPLEGIQGLGGGLGQGGGLGTMGNVNLGSVLGLGLKALGGLTGAGGPGAGESYSPDGEATQNGTGQVDPVQQLIQQIQVDKMKLTVDQATGNQAGAKVDLMQLMQDMMQLQQLTGGGQQPGAGNAPGGGGDAGGGGGAPGGGGGGGIPPLASGLGAPSSGAPSGGGGGAPTPMGGGGSPVDGGGAPSAPAGGGAPAGPAASPSSVGSSNKTYSGADGNVSQQALMDNVRTVADVARQKGVDPTTAVATMLVESGGNNRAVGDGGTSYGLFQLHRGGELPKGWGPNQAFDPRANANVALGEFARVQNSRGLSGGALAAAAQRPANPGAYARKVDANMGEASKLIQQSSQGAPGGGAHSAPGGGGGAAPSAPSGGGGGGAAPSGGGGGGGQKGG